MLSRLLLALLACLLLVRRAHAEAPERVASEVAASQGPRRTVLLLVSRAQGPWAEPAVPALKAQLRELPFQLEVGRVERLDLPLPELQELASVEGRRRNAAAVLWFDLSRAEEISLYRAGPKGARVAVQRIRAQDLLQERTSLPEETGPERGALRPALLEAAALLARASLNASLEREGRGEAMPLARPAPRATSPPPPLLRLSLAWGLEAASEQLPLQLGPRLRLGFPRLLPRVVLGLELAYLRSVELGEEGATLRVDRSPLALRVGMDWPLSERWALRPALGLGLEALSASAGALPDDRLSPGAEQLGWGIRPELSLAWLPRGSVFFQVGLGLQLVLGLSEIELEAPGGAELRYSPRLLQPLLTAGFGVSL